MNIILSIQTAQVSAGLVYLELSYLIAAILFVVGLKLLSHPETAKKGNFYAAAGMVLAMITTLFLHEGHDGSRISMFNVIIIVATIVVASIIGFVISKKVKMTEMPQLVSIFNATGGAASALVGLLEFGNPENDSLLVTLLGLAIGAIAFSGSLIAYGKLDGKIGNMKGANIIKYVNLILLALVTALIIFVLLQDVPQDFNTLVYILFGVAILYGILFVMPIGGADMPVVISLLNSLTGIAAAMAGFIYSNDAMILGGIFVGAAGTILTLLMCKAMNRSLINVIIGGFGGGAGSGAGTEGIIKEISSSDAGVLLAYSQRVVIIPGYGLAVAQAQHSAHELEKILEEKGVVVKYGIHPVAGRMPGHMNVLLAEADVSYDKLVEMDDINKEIKDIDVVIVVGANDVVNPAANNDASSPIYGMPIINASYAKNVIVMKRGMGKGYAGIENPLFFLDNTRMFFGNAKDSLKKLVDEIGNL